MIQHESDPPSPWAGYQRCMEDLPDCSHMLIVQDDVELMPGFVQAVKSIAEAQPDRPVCLFLGVLPKVVYVRALHSMKVGKRYVSLTPRDFMPIVAVLWPRHKLIEFSDWAVENPRLFGREDPRSDDAMAGRWKLRTRQTVLACVPSIVEHPDDEISTIGKTGQWRGAARRAGILAENAAEYDWSVS